LGRLTDLFGRFALGAGRVVVLATACIWLTRVKLGQVLHLDRVFARPTPSMVHLLRASPIVHSLVGRGHRASANIVEGVDAAIFLKPLGNRLVFGELVHDHLLVGLLGGKHI